MDTGILLACADPREGEVVSAARVGRFGVLGVGKALAAARLGAELARARPRLVILFGVCGAFPERHATGGPPLDVLDLCVVGDSVLADEGAATETGFVGLEELGLGSAGPFDSDAVSTAALAAALQAPVVRAATVSTCSGTEARSAVVAARTGARIETMESAACALVCREFGVPLVEARCVSNRTGDRREAGFALRAAAARMQEALLAVLRDGVFAA